MRWSSRCLPISESYPVWDITLTCYFFRLLFRLSVDTHSIQGQVLFLVEIVRGIVFSQQLNRIGPQVGVSNLFVGRV